MTISSADAVQNSVAISENERSNNSFTNTLLGVIGGGLNIWDRVDERRFQRRVTEQQLYTAGATIPVNGDSAAPSGGFLSNIKPVHMAIAGAGILAVLIFLKVK